MISKFLKPKEEKDKKKNSAVDFTFEIDKLLSAAKNKCDNCQINVSLSDQSIISIENNKMKDFSNGNSVKIMLKVWQGKKQGTLVSSGFYKEMLNDAILISKNNKDKEYFYGLPKKQKYVPQKIDRKLVDLEDDDLIDYAKSIMLEGSDHDVILSSAFVDKSSEKRIVANSNGLFAENKNMFFGTSVSCVSKNKKASYSDGFIEPFFVKYNNIGDEVRKKVHSFSNAFDLKKLTAKKNLPVIIKTEPLSHLLQNTFFENLNGYNYEKHKSCFHGEIGQKIFSDIDMIDDGTLQNGINSNVFDEEGMPRGKTKIIDKGVLKTMIYDYNTAINNKIMPTANAGNSGIEFTNLVIDGPKGNADTAIIVESVMGAHTANHLTTDFSCRAEHAYYYNNGTLTPIKSIMISGNLKQAFNNVIFVGKKQYHKNGLYSGDVCFDKISVTY